MKALVGVEIVAKDVLPQDAAVEGFDNIASALNVSPTFMEQYVEAARTIAKKAIGDRSLDSTSVRGRGAPRRGSHAARTPRRRHAAEAQLPGRWRIPVQRPVSRSNARSVYGQSRERSHAGPDDRWQGDVQEADRRTERSDAEQSQGRRRTPADCRPVPERLPADSGRCSRSGGGIHRSLPLRISEQPGRRRWRRRTAVVQQHRNQGALQPDRRCLDGGAQAALCLRSQGGGRSALREADCARTWCGAPSAGPLPMRTSPG